MFKKESKLKSSVKGNLSSKKGNLSSNEGQWGLPQPRFGKRDTGFKMDEILQRAELFKHEYNREDIHDRVLVLQVMPDDYEMREMTARLELHECKGATMIEVRSNVEVECPSEMSASGFRSNISMSTHAEDNAEGKCVNVTGFDSGAEDYQHFSCSTRLETVAGHEIVSDVEICEPDGTDIAPLHTGAIGLQSTYPGQYETENIYATKTLMKRSRWNECKTERNYFRSLPCNRAWDGDYYESRANNLVGHDSVKDDSTTANTSSKATYYSKACSMPEKPIPPPRTFFQEDSRGFIENETRLNVDTVKDEEIESGSSSEKTEFQNVEYEPGLDARNGIESQLGDESDSSASGSTSDVPVLREHRIYVHACWLALNSRYFRSLLFESGMRECTSTEFSMKVTESEEDAFLSLLKSIYDPNVLNNLEIANILNVLRLSAKYDVRFSTVKASRVLKAVPLTLENCEAIIAAVDAGGLPDLKEVMKNVEVCILSEFEPLDETWESGKFASLSEHALCFILGSDRLIVQSENTVFIALMHWIATNAELYGDITEYSDLLDLVRFEVMKPTYLNDVVQNHEVATQLDNFNSVYLKAITYHAMPSKRRKDDVKQRQWCQPKSPTFMWIFYPDPELFSFEDSSTTNSTQSSSFWYRGYKMHLRLCLSACQDESCLYLVVENLIEEGSVEIVYDVDVKFGEGVHRSFTCDPFVYHGNDFSSHPRKYPFDEKYSLGEIKEILLGSSVKVPITFEITVEKMLND